MLPKRSRLRGQSFPALLRRGRRVRGVLCSVVFVQEAEGFPQCACVASKRVAKKAVTRNRLRRRCYAALGHLYPKIQEGSRCIVFPNERGLKAPLLELQNEIASLISAILK